MIRLLVEAAADPNIKDKGGTTPLLRAAATSAISQVRALLQVGADQTLDNDEGATALDLSWKQRARAQGVRRREGAARHRGDRDGEAAGYF